MKITVEFDTAYGLTEREVEVLKEIAGLQSAERKPAATTPKKAAPAKPAPEPEEDEPEADATPEPEDKPAPRTRRTRKPKPEPKPEPEPEPEPEEDESDEDDDDDILGGADKAYTMDDAVTRATSMVNSGKAADAKKVLAGLGVKRVSELDDDGIAAFMTQTAS